MNFLTKKAVVVVAGVGPGLGASLVRKFAGEGCRVAMLARSQDFLDRLGNELRAEELEVLGFRCDVTRPGDVSAAFGDVRKSLGPIDVLIYHVGNAVWGTASELSPDDFEKSWRSCAWGGFLCVQEVVEEMMERKKGAILFTGATSSVRGRGDAMAFTSAKFAVRGMAHALADDLGPKGIHVSHIIIDGFIDTPEVRKRYDLEGEPAVRSDAAAESYWHLANQHPSAWSFEIDLRHHGEKLME